MSDANKAENSNRAPVKRVFAPGTAVLLLSLLLQARAIAQSTAGPLPAAAPSDQASQAPTAPSTAQIAAKPNLAGTWKLNADQSDNPMQKMREAQQDSDGQVGGSGRRGGIGGGGWGGDNGGGQQNGENQQRGRRQGGMPMSQLVIEQTPTSVKVTDPSGRVMALYLAASEQASSPSSANSSNGDANATAVAQWEDNKLVATQPMRNGGTTTRTYEISPDNKQLVVTTKIENKRFKEPVTMRQVYDPVRASTGGD
jgi:hypothetical protein